MKVALLGTGRTGQFFLKNAPFEVTAFNTTNPITLEKLKGHDYIVSFLPGNVFETYINLLIEAKIPVLSGSTGFHYPKNFEDLLIQEKLIWIQANNFSIGMAIAKEIISHLSQMNIPEEFLLKIKEIHHIHKLDAPSGTALRWKDWTNRDIEIESERVGDVVGIHSLTLTSPDEEITITHDAKKRDVFAKGAIWACENFKSFHLDFGLHQFDDLITRGKYE